MPPPDDDESDLFHRAMQAVRPLRRRRRRPAPAVAAEAPKPAPPAVAAPPPARPRAAPAKPKPPAPLPPLMPGMAAGIDKRTATRLRRGRLEIEARIDLHGLTEAAAHAALHRFVLGAARDGRRCLLVVTGKGRGGEGVIRRGVPRWLNEAPLRPLVLSFATAGMRDGGEGALYLLLRRKRAG